MPGNDSHYKMSLTYYVNGRGLHFGRQKFSLIMGFRFGAVSFSYYIKGDMKFRDRVFPHRVGLTITSLNLLGVIKDEEYFRKLCDADAIQVCLLLCLEVIFMGHLLVTEVNDTLMRLVDSLESWNAFPWEYSMVFDLGYLQNVSAGGKLLTGSVDIFVRQLVLGRERNGGVFEKLEFSNEFCHLREEFCDELSHSRLCVCVCEDVTDVVRRGRKVVLRGVAASLIEDEKKAFIKERALEVKKRWDEDYRKRSYAFMNSDHMKQAMARCSPKKISHSLVVRIDSWLRVEMWHVGPNDANWAMVSNYFVQLLLQNAMPLCGDSYDLECRDWYIRIRDCLQVRLAEVLELVNVFDKKGIDKSTYHVTFRIAENMPKQGCLW
ncbi:hypothetical protein Tco_0886595 [Tanacetum coccineum]